MKNKEINIFKDEPTSGMDPSIRRKIWNLITKLKKDKVIILTTHSMAEAEAIGDKIAILALGRLRAIGTTLHLKNRFGAGYSLDVVTGDTNALKNKILEISPRMINRLLFIYFNRFKGSNRNFWNYYIFTSTLHCISKRGL